MKGLRFLASRGLTAACYALAIIGATSWDDEPNSWRLIFLRLGADVIFLWWAVARTIRHYNEDHHD